MHFRLARFLTIFAVGIALPLAAAADAQTVVRYTYDRAGRIMTALYDNGVCVVYAYDANGNRTSRTIMAAGAPNTPTWGTGRFGCFNWA